MQKWAEEAHLVQELHDLIHVNSSFRLVRDTTELEGACRNLVCQLVQVVIEQDLKNDEYRLQCLIKEIEELQTILISISSDEQEKIRIIELRIAMLLKEKNTLLATLAKKT